tara:strand:- start:102 stop:1328 length:1227 start_codon:yes stop_codon:yes gene_type:complete
VCIETIFDKNTGNIKDTVPLDLLNQEEKIYGEFITLGGSVLRSQGFTVEMDTFSKRHKRVMYVVLPYIENFEERVPWHKGNTYLNFEFSEYVDIPFNKSNETISTSTSSKSISRNEAVIKMDDYEVSILKESEYSSVKVSGDFNAYELLDCIIFYIGFSCGCMPQPYIITICDGDEVITKIKSINNQKSHKRSSNPIPSNVIINSQSSGEYSYSLLKKIILLQQNNLQWFTSIYNQWARVWHGYDSIDDVSELVLSVAVEGVLNDVYIPVFKKSRIDIKLSDDIELIKKAISTLDVEESYKSRLKGSVSHWRDITASNAFDILIGEEIINANDKKIWKAIRNDSAHPKNKVLNSAEEMKKRNEVIRCLNLFHKLVLNIIGYSGPTNLFEVGNKKPMVELKHINVLHDK